MNISSSYSLKFSDFNFDDFFRDGKTIKGTVFNKAIYHIRGFFSGGSKNLDNEQFSQFYTSSFSNTLSYWEQFSKSESSEEPFYYFLKHILVFQAKINMSSWAKNLSENHDYKAFNERVKALHKAGKNKVSVQWAKCKTSNGMENREEVYRWIKSTSFQRQFAVASPSGQLPYKMEEIPAGAVLLSQVKPAILGLKVRGLSPTFWQRFRALKAGLVKVFTGSTAIHTEISLGEGRFFHLDKKGGQLFSGNGYIEDRRPKEGKSRICFQHQVLVPNREKMVKDSGALSFDQFFTPIKDLVEAEGSNIKGDVVSIAKLAFPSNRSKDYDAKAAWDPENKKYACSGVVATLFGKFGVDIGLQFGKKVEEITPGDYERSDYFQKFYS